MNSTSQLKSLNNHTHTHQPSSRRELTEDLEAVGGRLGDGVPPEEQLIQAGEVGETADLRHLSGRGEGRVRRGRDREREGESRRGRGKERERVGEGERRRGWERER